MIEVSLFVDGEHNSRFQREVVPRVGESIELDRGYMVKVVEVSHDWSDPSFIQVNTKRVKEGGG